MRGRSSIGSASSSPRAGMAEHLGNSIILAVASLKALSRDLVSRGASVCGWAAGSIAVTASEGTAIPLTFSATAVVKAALAGADCAWPDLPAGRGEVAPSAGSNFSRSDGYRGPRDLVRER